MQNQVLKKHISNPTILGGSNQSNTGGCLGFTRLATKIVYLYMAILPFDWFLAINYGLPLSPSFFVLGAMVFVYLLVGAGKGFRISYNSSFLFMILLVAYCIFTLFWSKQQDEGIKQVLELTVATGTVIVLFNLLKRIPIKIINVVWAYVFGTLFVGLYAYFQVDWSRRFTIAEGFNPTWYAALLVWALFGCSFLFFHTSSKRSRVLSFGIALVLLYFLMLTGGRNAIMALFVSLPIALFSYVLTPRFLIGLRIKTNDWRLIKRFLAVMILILVVACGFIVITDNQRVVERYVVTIGSVFTDPDVTTAGRLTIWENYLSLPQTVLGVGVGSASAFYASHIGGKGWTPHNVYLLLMTELGLLGLILWCTIHFLLIKAAWRYKGSCFTLLWMAVFFPLFGLGNDILYYRYYWIGIFLFFTFLAYNQRHHVSLG